MEYATIGRRLAAYFIDVLPLTLISVPLIFLTASLGDPFEAFRADHPPESYAALISRFNVLRAIRVVAWLTYFVLMENSAWQGTVGMRLLGIRVVDDKGRRLTLTRSFARNICKLISAIPCFLGVLWAVISKKNQTWHDLLAKTYVIRHR